MAKGKETGKGLVTVNDGKQDPLNPFPVKSILLHNFNFDGDEVKQEHKDELDKRVVKQIIEKRQVVKITGHASKQGNAAYNLELSRRRAQAVRNYLIKKGVPLQFLPIELLVGRGEEDSKSIFEDDELDRGVVVEFVPDFKPKPQPPKPKQDPPPPPPDIIVKPPFPMPMPVPDNVKRLVFVREVYINHTLIEGGGGKTDRTVEGWRRIDSLTVTSQVPIPFDRELSARKDDQKFFINVFQAVTGQRDQYDSVTYVYKYDPESVPSTAPIFVLPDNNPDCRTLYSSGTPVDRLPRP